MFLLLLLSVLPETPGKLLLTAVPYPMAIRKCSVTCIFKKITKEIIIFSCVLEAHIYLSKEDKQYVMMRSY